MVQPSSSSSKKKSRCFSMKDVWLIVLSGGICFYAGIVFGMHIGYGQGEKECLDRVKEEVKSRVQIEKQLQQTSRKEQEQEAKKQQAKEQDCNCDDNNKIRGNKWVKNPNNNNRKAFEARFPKGVSEYAVGMGYVSRDDFTSKFDMGVPLDKTSQDNNHVLILYTHRNTLPITDPTYAGRLTSTGVNGLNGNDKQQPAEQIPFMDDVEIALENCEVLNVILAQPKAKENCIAIMGQYQSYHIQKLMRIPANTTQMQGKALRVQKHLPLRHVNRNAKAGGGLSVKIPNEKHTKDAWEVLSKYLQTLDGVLADLKPIAETVASNSYNKKTIIVMVTNYGQSELLMNFVCAARHRNFHSLLKTVLVFATDLETKELAEGMGLTVFYDEVNFERFPKNAARRYADKTFTSVMMAKVYCVQMINLLGYDLLFQDVDMIWYRNPIQFFVDSAARETQAGMSTFDLYFQDDGNHGSYYAPYSANTGFYFVRYNDRTRYFFSTLLQTGDLITSAKSHQVALISLLSEHASMYGLRVKVLKKEEFPGGFHYNQKNQRIYMRTLMENVLSNYSRVTDKTITANPYIFHMSWTHNKDNKIKYFQQMGEWYFKEQCMNKQPADIQKLFGIQGGNFVEQNCCLIEPLFKCHYRDKPSLKSCKDSPPIDQGGASFW